MKLFGKRFPFSDAPNTMCFTCCHVLDEKKPIRYISHDEDGCWQFLCGRSHTEDEARIVSLAEMLEIDRSIAKFAASLPRVEKLHLLPYHRLGMDKYASLGRQYTLPDILPPSEAKMEALLAVAQESGLKCQIGG